MSCVFERHSWLTALATINKRSTPLIYTHLLGILICLSTWSCHEPPPPLESLQLPLKVELYPFWPAWREMGRYQLFMDTADGEHVELPIDRSTIVTNDQNPWSKAVFELKGPWRAPLIFTFIFETTEGESRSWTTEIKEHPLLDHRRRYLFSDHKDERGLQVPRVNIHLQPLSFLSQQRHSWAETLGFNSDLWWSTETQDEEQRELMNLIQEAWSLAQLSSSPSPQSHIDHSDLWNQSEITQLWLSLDKAIVQPQWALSFTRALQDLYRGRELDQRLAKLLIHSPCAPLRLELGIGPHEDDHDLQALSDCLSSQSERVYFERPEVQSTLRSSIRQITARAIGLSQQTLNSLRLSWRHLRDDEESLSVLTESDRVSTWSIDGEEFSIIEAEASLDWRDINRPHVEIEQLSLDQVGIAQSKRWSISLETPITATLHTHVSLIEALKGGSLLAQPLSDFDSRRDEGLELKNVWQTKIDDDGNAKLEITGYSGPIRLTSYGLDGEEYVSSIIDLPLRQEDLLQNEVSGYAEIGAWLSPHSSFGVWLFDRLSPLFTDTESTASGVIDPLNRSHRALFHSPMVSILSNAQTSRASDEAHTRWYESLSLAKERWSQCAQGLISRYEINETDLINLEKLGGEESISAHLNLQEVNRPNEVILSSVSGWVRLMEIACFHEALHLPIAELLSLLKSFGIERLHRGDIDVARAFIGVHPELNLSTGIWSRQSSNGVWRISNSDNLRLQFRSSRGLTAVSLSASGSQANESLTVRDLDLQPILDPEVESSTPCLWHPQLTRSVPSLLELGEWSLLSTAELQTRFPTRSHHDAESTGWEWYPNLLEPETSTPLPCSLSLGTNAELNDGSYQLEILAELWGSEEDEVATIEALTVDFEVDHSYPTILNIEPTRQSEKWFFHSSREGLWRWVSDESSSSDDASKLTLVIKTDRPTRCLTTTSHEQAFADTSLGSFTIPPQVPNDPLMLIRDIQAVEIIEPLVAASPYQSFERFVQLEDHKIQETFIAYRSYQLTISPQPEGESGIYLRCEDVLGHATVNHLIFTADSHPPEIVSATLHGFNEASIRDPNLTPKPGIARDEVERELNLLELNGSEIKWARWINHWQSCPEQCPTESLSELTLVVHATDHLSLNQELEARLHGRLFIPEGPAQQSSRLEHEVSMTLGPLDEEGQLTFNLYQLLNRSNFTGFPPLHGDGLHFELIITISDFVGHKVDLPIHLTLSPIAPMVRLRYLPSNDPLDELISSGSLDQALNADLGRLEVTNPHPVPVKVSLHLPSSLLELSTHYRDSGLPVESLTLQESCLFNDSNTFNPQLRLIDYRLNNTGSIIGQCVSLPQLPSEEQSLTFSADQWRRESNLSLEEISLDAFETIEINLPRYRPPLAPELRALILTPNVPPTESDPSPFQRRLFNETSIYQRSINCQQCPPSFIAGNRIESLLSWHHRFQATETHNTLLDSYRREFDVPYFSAPWLINVRSLLPQARDHLMRVSIDLDSAYILP